MLPKINRLKKEKDFEAIFKNSKSVRNNLFVFKAKNNNLDKNRFGFVVSKKISTKATVRNKVRRRMAAIMASFAEKINPCKDLLLIALPGIEKKEFLEIREAIEKSLEKVGAINK